MGLPATSLVRRGIQPYGGENFRALGIAQNIAALTALSLTGLASGYAVQVLGYYAEGDGGGGVFYLDLASAEATNGGTVIATSGAGRWIRDYDGTLDVRWFGAKGDGVADDSAAIQAAIDANPTGCSVEIPPGDYLHSNSIVVSRSMMIRGGGSVSRQLEDGAKVKSGVRLIYSGASMALSILRDGGGTLNGVFVHGIEFRPSVSGASADGVVLNPSSSAIIGSEFVNCKFVNFGRSQIKSVTPGDVWDIRFQNCSVVNTTTSTENAMDFLDSGAGGFMIQVVDCYVQSRAAGFYGVAVGGGVIRGGAIESFDGHGLKIGSGSVILGTHFEGFLASGIIGVDFTGNGCIIAPSSVQSFVTGVKIGGINARVIGNITSNTTDVLITSGASRRGTIINGQGLTISDLRAANDGVLEVTIFKNGVTQIPGALTGITSISQTATEAKNLRGNVGLADAATKAVLAFGTAEPNANYYVVLTPVFSTSGAAAGSNRILSVAKTTAGFTVTVEAAPGAGKAVNFDWVLVR